MGWARIAPPGTLPSRQCPSGCARRCWYGAATACAGQPTAHCKGCGAATACGGRPSAGGRCVGVNGIPGGGGRAAAACTGQLPCRRGVPAGVGWMQGVNQVEDGHGCGAGAKDGDARKLKRELECTHARSAWLA
eukprot:85280-Chlamydomonas_euryale.AAC.1